MSIARQSTQRQGHLHERLVQLCRQLRVSIWIHFSWRKLATLWSRQKVVGKFADVQGDKLWASGNVVQRLVGEYWSGFWIGCEHNFQVSWRNATCGKHIDSLSNWWEMEISATVVSCTVCCSNCFTRNRCSHWGEFYFHHALIATEYLCKSQTEPPEQNTTTVASMQMGIGSSKVRHGTTLEVICDEHYEFPLTTLAPPTCNNGTWSTIPRCVPARCKTLPKPPKFGMVISPKTEHGMKARFKCKDGWQLATPAGKQITDQNENVLTCSFGNWTGETPMCQEGKSTRS